MSPDGPEYDDTDTGPVNIVTPPPGGAWTNYFDSSVLVPRPVPYRRRRRRMLLAAAGAAAVAFIVLAAVAFWAFRPSSSTLGAPQTAAGESADPSPVPDPEAETRLLRLIPPGYPPGACSAVAPPSGALAKLDCVKNADSGGPSSASYTLLPDKGALATTFDEYVDGIGVVNCPRNMQSPVLCPTGVSKTGWGIASARMGATVTK